MAAESDASAAAAAAAPAAAANDDAAPSKLSQWYEGWLQRRCERQRKTVWKDPRVQFLAKSMNKLGCPVSPRYIQCGDCGEHSRGRLSRDEEGATSVLLNSSIFQWDMHMRRTVQHELIHAFDHCRANVDWDNLHHRACTEIRAAQLSGDCDKVAEWMRGRFTDRQGSCVRRRAIMSVRMHPKCGSDEEAEAAVDAVWDTCKADLEPFGVVP